MNHSINFSKSANQFVLTLAELMSDYGASVHEIEDAMFTLNDTLQLNGSFVLFNRILLTSYADSTGNNQVNLQRFGASKVNLHKLEQVEIIFHQVAAGQLAVTDGLQRLTQIKSSGRLYNRILDFLSWPLLSAGFVLILSGNWLDLICSSLISILIYKINAILSRNDNGTGLRIAVPTCAFVAAFLAVISNLIFHSTSIAIIATSSLMKFMPGLYLTQAITEIAYRRLISGMAHLCEAIFILVILALGVFLGTALGNLLIPVSLVTQPGLTPLWKLVLAGSLIGSSFIFSFDIIKRHIPIVIIASIIVTIIWINAKVNYGPIYGTAVAALSGALMANLYARISGSSDLVLKLPTAVIIVPGIFAFRALIDILNNNTVPGVEHFLTTFTLGAAIAGGFLIVDIIIPAEFIHNRK